MFLCGKNADVWGSHRPFQRGRHIRVWLLPLGLLHCSRDLTDTVLASNIDFAGLGVFDFQVCEFWMHTKGQIARQSPA